MATTTNVNETQFIWKTVAATMAAVSMMALGYTTQPALAEEPVVVDTAPEDPQSKMTDSEYKLEEDTRKAKLHSGQLKIFSGNGNMSLAQEICRNLGVNLGKATVGRFADGEVQVEIQENVRYHG